MRNGTVAAIGLIGVIVGFVSGWLTTQVQNIHDITPAQARAEEWISDITLLTGGDIRTKGVSAKETQLLVSSNLNATSLILGRVYDNLPKDRKQQISLYIAPAHALVSAQQNVVPTINNTGLRVFIDCVQKADTGHGPVKDCMKRVDTGNR